MESPLVLAAALAVFLIVFVRNEFGLYLVIFSMLLSPQLGSGGTVAGYGGAFYVLKYVEYLSLIHI